MADNLKAVGLATSSTPDPSQSLDNFDDTKIGRSFVRISTDQAQLLDGHKSWAAVLNRRHDGFVNVPPAVIQQLKDCYSRQKRDGPSGNPADMSRPTGNKNSSPRSFRSQQSLPPSPEPTKQGVAGTLEADEDQVSWASSPEAHMRPPREGSEDPVQAFVTQLPEKSPTQSTLQTSPERQPLPDFPQSSQGHEDELEVEVPTALAYNTVSVNKSALPMLATPPSAQIVPCTFAQSENSAGASSDPKAGPPPRKTIYKPVPELYRPPKRHASATHLRTSAVAVKNAAQGHHTSTAETSSSSVNVPSSIIPSTSNHVDPKEHPLQTSIASPLPMSTYQTDVNLENQPSLLMSEQDTPIYIAPSPAHPISPPMPLIDASIRGQRAVEPLTWQKPFDRYIATYPSYSGTLQDFITACMYIQLQFRRIRTSLYDDFIRAWAHGYLVYIRECDEREPPVKALRAIEWYNEIDDDPLFTCRVVTRQNIDDILQSYPVELRMARSSLGVTKNEGSDHSRTTRCATEDRIPPESGIPATTIAQAPASKETLPVVEILEPATASSAFVSPTSRGVSNPVGDTIPVHKSFGGIDSRQERTKGMVRSVSDIPLHKRKASEMVDMEAKRRSFATPTLEPTNRQVGSDSGSVASDRSRRPTDISRRSVTPARGAGKPGSVKNGETAAEIHDRRWAKHVRKLKARRDSIMSSAPVGNSPTSGQRQ